MSFPIDQAQAVRDGEQLDLERLSAYLAGHLPGATAPLAVEQFPHGHSNLTYLIHVGTEEWVLRRPPFGNLVKTAHDMGREYRILSRLCTVYPPAPRPVLYCDDESILGAPFYLMERRQGVILRGSPSADCADDARAGQAALRDPGRSHGRAAWARLSRSRAGRRRQAAGLRRAAGHRLDQTLSRPRARIEVPDLERAAAWLAENIPAESAGASLIHNDFKFDNLVLDPSDMTHIVALLDWEMATIGDPLMDLGTTLAYWTEAADPEPLHHHIVGPTKEPGSLTRREIVERYARLTGRDVSNMLFCYVCGLFKVAVIAQQIFARYQRGLTRDPRFAVFDKLVAALGLGAVRAIDRGRC